VSEEGLARDPLNIVVCGVGGQGNVLASRLLGKALTKLGYLVTIGETYGVSQRGGPVMSHIRASRRRSFGPLIPKGMAHIVLGFEPMEALRILGDYGSSQVAAIVNTRAIYPVTVGTGMAQYPGDEQLKEAIRNLTGRVWFIPATDMALGLGTPIVTNIIMLGALIGAGLIPVGEEPFEETLREHFPPGRLELNLRAFQAGLEAIRRASVEA
jgi:indolepyruvate ferredoxin oxidoreductase beta subunit